MKNKGNSLVRFIAIRLESKNLFVLGILSLAIVLFLYDLQGQSQGGVNVVTSESLRQDVTMLVSIAGLFSAFGALVFSGLSRSSQNKNQYYQILKDFESEYSKLVEIESQLKEYVKMTFADLSRQPREVIEDVELYRWKFYQFHERLAHLALRGIIPKEIARYYSFSFRIDLHFIDIDFDPQALGQELVHTMRWCRDENLEKASNQEILSHNL